MANSIQPNLIDILRGKQNMLINQLFIARSFVDESHTPALLQRGKTISVPVFQRIASNGVQPIESGGDTQANAGNDITTNQVALVQETLTVDRVVNFGALIKDIEEVRTNISLWDNTAREAAYQLSNDLDTEIFKDMAVYTQAYSDSQVVSELGVPSERHVIDDGAGAPLEITDANALVTLNDVRVTLENESVYGDYIALVDNNFVRYLRNSSSFDATEMGASMRRGSFITREPGYSGTIAGMAVYASTNLRRIADYIPTGGVASGQPGVYNMFFKRDSYHFVAQFDKMKITESNDGFSGKYLGETIFGGTIFPTNQPKFVAVVTKPDY